jgi:hypothetical protein
LALSRVIKTFLSEVRIAGIMAKCVTCGERKGNRVCPAVNGGICSLCCGSKRQKEIRCVDSCDYLKKGGEYQLERDITRKISQDLHAESEDVFDRDDVALFVMSIEGFFVDRFYPDSEVNDTHILQSLNRLYAFLSGTLLALDPENRIEELILKKFDDANRKNRNLPDTLKARAILRIIKSIRSSSGGVLGNRNYLEMIYSQHTGKGKWVDLFGELESKE